MTNTDINNDNSGDSYSATGFDITDDRPLPSPENPLGNPPFPGHTWAVGPNWVSHLTSTFNRSLILTYNFAYGGATISDDLVPSTSPIEIPSLATQIRHQFLPRTGTWTPTQRTAENSIYFLWVGINDVIRGPGEVLSHQMAPAGPTEGGQRGGTVDTWKLLVDLMHQEVDRYMSLLDQLFHAASARRFIIMSVPPIDRSPAILQNPDAARKTVKALVSVFNSLLEQRVEAWKMAKRGAEVEWYDTGRLFHDIMDRPGKWGFKNATGACPVYYV